MSTRITACIGRALALSLMLGGALASAQTAPVAAEKPAVAARATIKLAPELLDSYVGRYMIDPQHLIDVTRDGDRLFGQGTGLPKMELFAVTQTLFDVPDVKAQLDFGKADDGAPQLLLIQAGHATPGKKIN